MVESESSVSFQRRTFPVEDEEVAREHAEIFFCLHYVVADGNSSSICCVA